MPVTTSHPRKKKTIARPQPSATLRLRELEAALQAREREYAATFELAAVGMAHVGMDGRWLRVNQKLCDIVGYTAEELLGRTFQDITFPDDLAWDLAQMQELRRGERATYAMEERYIRKDGQVVWVNLTVALVRDAAGNPDYCMSIIEDISARKAAEEERAQVLAREQIARGAAEAQARQMATIFETVSDALAVYDATGQLVHINAAGRHMFGLNTAAAYAEGSPQDRADRWEFRNQQGRLLTLEDLPLPRILQGQTIDGTTVQDMRMRTPDGQEILISTSGAPIRAEDGRIVGAVTITRDVTERRQLEQRTQAALEALLRMAATLVRIPDAAPIAETMPRDVQRVVSLIQQVLAGGYTGVILIDGATQALRPLAVVGLPPATAARWRAQLQGAHVADYLPPDLARSIFAGEIYIENLATKPPIPGQDYFDIQTVLAIAVPLANGDHCLLSIEMPEQHVFLPEEIDLARAAVQLTVLVIERERLWREAAEAQARELALQATNDHMLAFLGIAGHELRTPVTNMKASVQLAARTVDATLRTELPEAIAQKLTRAKDLLTSADRQSVRLNRLIEELLDVTRVHANKFDVQLCEVDLRVVVREAVENQRLAWPDRAITLVAPDQSVLIACDEDRIGQVVTNYLTNALKYSAPATPVQVQISAQAEAVRVAVTDQGPGIPLAAQAQLWELFHQVAGISQQSGNGVGLGIGLYLCKTIIERHHGAVGVESQVGQGSTFWFILPRSTERDGHASGK